MKGYQENYAAGRPQMYHKGSRLRKGQRVIRVLEDYFGKKKLKNLSVLDIGSSTGIIDSVLAKSSGRVAGIDIDKGAVSFAGKNYKRKNLSFEVGDSMNLKFKADTFDVVVCMQVYEHVPSAPKLLSEIRRVLKKGGVCYFFAINRLWPWEPHYNLFFLSWLPKSLANIYLRLTGKGKFYYETLHSYWGLARLARKFEIIDYTPKIIMNPKKFLYPAMPKIASILLALPAKYLSPSFVWLIKKK